MVDPMGLFGGGAGLTWKDGHIRSVYEIDPKQRAEAAQREREAREDARKQAAAHQAALRAVNPHVYYRRLHEMQLGFMSREQAVWSRQYDDARATGSMAIPPPPTLGTPTERFEKEWVGGIIEQDLKQARRELVDLTGDAVIQLGSGPLFAGFGKGLRAVRSAVRAGEAGRFAGLEARAVVGDLLTPHHMPQAALNYTSRADGGAIVLLQGEHELTRTYGVLGKITAREEAGLPFRTVLARDIRDVRHIAGPKYNEGLKGVLEYYRKNFPELMKKTD